MTIPIHTANVYTDLQSLDKIRYAAEENSTETLRFVAEQFEAIFLQMMLKSSRGEVSDDGLFENQQTEFYQDWHDKQLSIDLASGRGMGIAEMLIRQLQTQESSTPKITANTDINSAISSRAYVVVHSPLSFGDKTINIDRLRKPSVTEFTSDTVVKDVKDVKDVKFETPQAFVKHLWPLAKDAAQKLGVAAEVILAQAALETGWGQKITKNSMGHSSHNLFNIKADGRWQGERVSVPTLEYRDGVAVRETAHFRVYDSFAESFSDYVAFMKGSPRYQIALEVAADAEAYTRELSQAGYATDPDYASKINRIASGERLQQALKSVKI